MDLYRYFHPHHNPRLRSSSLRLQEICELRQAAEELRRALDRAEIRSETAPVEPIEKEHFTEINLAISYVVDSLEALEKAHPGDDIGELDNLLKERADAPGWETWSRLLRQRLAIQTVDTPELKKVNER